MTLSDHRYVCVCVDTDPQVVPQTEDYWGHVNPIGSRSSYDVGKRAAEAMFTSYQKQVKDLMSCCC